MRSGRRYSTLPAVVQIVFCIRCGAEGVWRAAWVRSAAKPCACYVTGYVMPRGFVWTITQADRSDNRGGGELFFSSFSPS